MDAYPNHVSAVTPGLFGEAHVHVVTFAPQAMNIIQALDQTLLGVSKKDV
jgi:hypothetical protein